LAAGKVLPMTRERYDDMKEWYKEIQAKRAAKAAANGITR